MKTPKRGITAALALLMLLSVFPMKALAENVGEEAAPLAENIATEVTYNTGRAEVTVGYDVERWEGISSDNQNGVAGENNPYAVDSDTEIWESNDSDVWYDLFDENGGYTINLDLFEADPLFPYEVQFKYQGKTENRWFQTIDDTVEVGGHAFSLFCTSQPQTIGLWVQGEYFTAQPAEKEFTNEGGFGLFSMQPLTEDKTLTADLSSKLGSELSEVTISVGPTTPGVWTIAGTDNYLPFDSNTKIDLSPYMGRRTVTLELINGNDPLDGSLTRYIVKVTMPDISQLLSFQAYAGTKAVNSNQSGTAPNYNIYPYTSSLSVWNLSPITLKMKLGSGFSGYTADVYLGRFATEEAAKAADPSADITSQIWDGGNNSAGPGYSVDYSKQQWLTAVFKKSSGETVYVYPFIVYLSYNSDSRYSEVLEQFNAMLTVSEGEQLTSTRVTRYGNNASTGYTWCFPFYSDDYDAIPAQTTLKLDFADTVSAASRPKVTVYQGTYQTKAELDAAIATRKTAAVENIWGADAAGAQGNYKRWDQAPKFTLLLERGTVNEADWGDDIVLPIGAVVSRPSVSIYIGYSIYGNVDNSRQQVNDGANNEDTDDYATRTHTCIYTLNTGYAANDTYYAELDGYVMGESIGADNLETYIQKAVVGRCATADEVNAKEDIKAQLFSNAYQKNGGYGTDYSKGVTFTVLDVYGQLHYATIQTVAMPETLERPTPLSDDTYFRAQGANQSAEGTSYQSYFMKSTDDSYYYNGYQTVFLLNGDGSAVTDTTVFPTFWAGSKVNVYASLDTASGDKVESGKSPADITFGTPIHYSAGSESGTHLKNYWVTFVTKQAGGPSLFVNGATNSEHLDETTQQPVREVFLNANYGYHHDIFFANIGDAQMTGLSVTLSDDAQNIALDDYWKIGSTTTLAAFTTTECKDSGGKYITYGELPNVSKIRLVPKKNADGTLATGEISGTLTISYQGCTAPVVIKLTGTAAKPKITTTSIVPGVKYVHYSSVIQTDNMYKADGVEFKIATGTLPNGIILKPNGELYGVPTVTGDYTFTVQASYNGAVSDTKEFTLHIENNTHENVWNATDATYDVTTAIPNEDGTLTINAMDKGDNSFTNLTQLFVTKGEYPNFVELKLDGKLLEEGTDYTKEPGSTRITLQTQTLKNAGSGTTHTLSAEFREGDTMKRAAQNYVITPSQSNNNGGGSYPGSGSYPSGGTSPGGTTNPGTNPGGQTPATPSQPTLPFVDVPEQSWFYSEVAWAYENGFMVGVSETEFSPKAAIGQATVVTVLARMAKVDLDRFSAEGYDNITSGQWYSSAAVWATQSGLLPDYTTFVETGSISRGSMAIMLVKYLRSMGFDTSLPSSLAEFADAEFMTQEEFEAFQVLYHYGIFLGIGGMRMDPVGITSRCEFSTLVHRLNTLLGN